MSRPQPPLFAEKVEDLTTSFRNGPEKWLDYLRTSYQFIDGLENTIVTLHNDIEVAKRATETSAHQRDGVIQYQKEQIASIQQHNVELELELRLLKVSSNTAKPVTSAADSLSTDTNNVSSTPADSHNEGLPKPVTVSVASSTSHKEKQPDPKEFDGTRKDLRRFTQQIHGKMLVNGDRFPTATHRLIYVAGRLTGRAYELILPKISNGIPQFPDYTDMLEYLEQAFGDSDRVQNAQSKLFNLKQKNQEFSTYFAEFQSLALDGEMSETALTPLLYQGVSRELQDMLLHNPAPSHDFHAFSNHLHVLDNRYRRHQQQALRNRTTQPTRNTNSPNTTTPARPSQATAAPSTRTDPPRPTPATSSPAYDPMDLSLQKSTAANGRRERGECFRCGSKSHLVSRCPEPDTRNFIQARSSQLFITDAPSADRPDSPSPSVASSVNGTSLN